MATNTTQQITAEARPLTVDEGWDLIFSLFGSAKELYAKAGGAEAWIRSERAAWAEEPSR
jgi:hypothetical protein